MSAVMERSNGAMAHPQIGQDVMERVLIGGDLARLNPLERMSYYKAVCESIGLNPLTKPFEYLQLNGKLTLYARKDCTEQLRKIHGVSIERLEKQQIDGVYVVTAYAKDRSGRTDGSTGAVTIGGLKGEALANALMKAETKAKRRVTLSVCGLGMLDEAEVESIPNATVMPHDAIPAQIVATPEGRITIEQCCLLDDLINEVGADKAKFLRYLKIDSLEALTVQAYGDAVAALEAKRKATAK